MNAFKLTITLFFTLLLIPLGCAEESLDDSDQNKNPNDYNQGRDTESQETSDEESDTDSGSDRYDDDSDSENMISIPEGNGDPEEGTETTGGGGEEGTDTAGGDGFPEESTESTDGEEIPVDPFNEWDCDVTDATSCNYMACASETSMSSAVDACNLGGTYDCGELTVCHTNYLNCFKEACPVGSSAMNADLTVLDQCASTLNTCTTTVSTGL